MVLMRDDFTLVESPLLNVRRANLMRDWYALNRDDSDRLVKRTHEWIVINTEVDWPPEIEEV